MDNQQTDMIKELCTRMEILPDKGSGDRTEIEQYKIILATEGIGIGNRFEITIMDTDRVVDVPVCQIYIKEEEAKLIMSYFKCHI